LIPGKEVVKRYGNKTTATLVISPGSRRHKWFKYFGAENIYNTLKNDLIMQEDENMRLNDMYLVNLGKMKS